MYFCVLFVNFCTSITDLKECLAHVRKTWTEKDKEEFLSDLKQNGAHFYRIPRGFNEYNDNELGELNNSKDLDKQEE